MGALYSTVHDLGGKLSATSRTIAFIQPFVPTYRRGLFDAIAARLAVDGFELEVWHAEPVGRAAARRNAIRGTWSRLIRQYRISIGNRNLTFRPIVKRAREPRVVVAGLASTNIETYLLAADPRVNLMLWGHGKNFTASNVSLDSKLESWLCKRAAHVFAYTIEGREHLIARGMPESKVSTVMNTTDTSAIRSARAQMTEPMISSMRNELELSEKVVALFVGALDESKRLPFLFSAADKIAEANSKFRLLIAGAGPLDDYVRHEADVRDYVTMLGPRDTREVGEISSIVDILLMPGRVGLVAVDSLALGIPLATTKFPFHAPEAAYLNELNSLWTEDDIDSFATGVLTLLDSPGRLAELSANAGRDGEKFSMDKSAEVFVNALLDFGTIR